MRVHWWSVLRFSNNDVGFDTKVLAYGAESNSFVVESDQWEAD